MQRLVVGMDPSTTHLAIVVLGLDDRKLVGATTIKPRVPAGLERLCTMAEAARDFVKGFPGVAVVAVEDLYVQRPRRDGLQPPQNPGVVIELARLGGMVQYLLWRRGMPTELWQATEWRRVVLGRSVAKDRVALELYKRYGADLADGHQADAYGVAMAAVLRRNPPAALPCRLPPAGVQAILLEEDA